MDSFENIRQYLGNPTLTRRTFLTISITGLAGCQSLLSKSDPEDRQEPTVSPEPTETAGTPTPTPKITPTGTSTPTSTPTPTPTPADFEDEGYFHVVTADGIIGSNGYFDRGEVGEDPDNELRLTIEVEKELYKAIQEGEELPEDHDLITEDGEVLVEPWVDPRYQPPEDEDTETVEHLLTTEELRERYQHNQYLLSIEDLNIQNEGQKQNPRETLRKLPHKLEDYTWLKENLYDPFIEITNQEIEEAELEKYTIGEIKDFWEPKKFKGDQSLKKRTKNSGYITSLWNTAEQFATNQVLSTNDYLRADFLSACDYHTAGNHTATFSAVTNTGAHGLAWAVENPTYNKSKFNNQETWIFETVPVNASAKDKWFIDIDEQETYTQGEKVFIDTEDPEGGSEAWRLLGIPIREDDYLDIEYRPGERFEDFLKNPETQPGMAYVDSACLAAYVNEHADDGRFEDWESITVSQDQIEYQKAS